MRNSEKSGKYSVVIEDNGRVAYAYLLENDEIIGDVWIYNCDPTPNKPEWDIPSKMPFLNSKTYVAENRIPNIEKESDWHVKWHCNGQVLERVELLCLKENLLIAVLKPNSKPGWSYFAKKDGPLAKVLNKNTI